MSQRTYDSNGKRNVFDKTDTLIADVPDVVLTHDAAESPIISNETRIAFRNLTFCLGNAKGHGFTSDYSNIAFDHCTIQGNLSSFTKASFVGCTFTDAADYYNLTIHDSRTTKLSDCTFNSADKAVYVGGTAGSMNSLLVSNCAFNASSSTSKAPLDIHTPSLPTISLFVWANKLGAEWTATDGKVRASDNLWMADAAKSTTSAKQMTAIKMRCPFGQMR